jgi:hypothetical protein
MYEYTIRFDDQSEAERMESIAVNAGCSRFNQEGWATSYGGNGITVWVEMGIWKPRDMKQVLGCFNTGILLATKKI